MNLKTNIENWLLNDPNPFIIFSNNGKILYLNNAAEYFLSFISPKEIYKTIINYAPKDLGFEIIQEKFSFGDFHYDYALIGYDNYDEIGVKFYENLHPIKKTINFEEMEKINIYMLLELARTYTFIDKEIEFIDMFDPDLPEMRFDKNELIKIFSEIYTTVKDNKKIKTEVKIKIGEYIKIEQKKYKMLEINIYANNIICKNIEFENVNIEFFDNKISILLPFII